MKRLDMVKSVTLLCIVGAAALFVSSSASARQALMSGRAQGMASVDISAATIDKVDAALQKVFVNDEGYSLANSGDSQYVFERPAGRIKDLSYSGLAGGGVIERAVVDITQLSGSAFRLTCNVYMVETNGDPFFDSSTKVLRAFGREYKRVLRRVKREANR